MNNSTLLLMSDVESDMEETPGWLTRFHDSYRPAHVPLVIAICLFGVFANIINIVVLIQPAMRKNPTNIILLGLSVAQLLLVINFLCYTAYSQVFDDECNYGSKTFNWLAVLLMNVNFTVVLHSIALVHTVMLGIARYVIIHFVGKQWITTTRATYTSIGVFIFMPVFGISFYFNSEIVPVDAEDMEDCRNFDPKRQAYRLTFVDNWMLKSYNFWIFSVFCKLLPCVCLVIASVLIIRDLRLAEKRHQRLCHGNDRSSTRQLKRSAKQQQNLRTTQLLLIICCLFVIVELPQGICNLFIALQMSGILSVEFPISAVLYNLGDFFEMLTVLYSGINFLLYCVMSGQFRATFCRTFVCPCLVAKWKSLTSLLRRTSDGASLDRSIENKITSCNNRRIEYERSTSFEKRKITAVSSTNGRTYNDGVGGGTPRSEVNGKELLLNTVAPRTPSTTTSPIITPSCATTRCHTSDSMRRQDSLNGCKPSGNVIHCEIAVPNPKHVDEKQLCLITNESLSVTIHFDVDSTRLCDQLL